MKPIKAWAFLGGEKGKEYFITDQSEVTTIYLKKPEPRTNPFDYQRKGWKWKPTKILISIEERKSE